VGGLVPELVLHMYACYEDKRMVEAKNFFGDTLCIMYYELHTLEQRDKKILDRN
jgi:hypothetical protein